MRGPARSNLLASSFPHDYRELAERLRALGIQETDRNIANKISRGGFSAVFFVQCLEAMGVKEISLRRN